jgi:hypothetical protein
VDVSVDELWDALREHCCSTKPCTDAKAIVMLRRDDVMAALAAVAAKHRREAEAFIAQLEEAGRQSPPQVLVDLVRKAPPWVTRI